MDQLVLLSEDTLRRIAEAESLETLEEIRVEVLGRKGKLAAASKDMDAWVAAGAANN